jgi:hypothetical protein
MEGAHVADEGTCDRGDNSSARHGPGDIYDQAHSERPKRRCRSEVRG